MCSSCHYLSETKVYGLFVKHIYGSVCVSGTERGLSTACVLVAASFSCIPM